MKKILIDLVKLRDYEACLPDAVFYPEKVKEGLKTLREEATFQLTCRRCVDAPCMAVCPSEALEKDGDGKVVRNVNLCIRCKSCITICPFGTLMDDLFEKKDRRHYFNLSDQKELEAFLRECPAGVAVPFDGEADPGKHIHSLNNHVFVREHLWNE